MNYALVENGTVTRVGPRPKWFHVGDDGEPAAPLSDADLLAQGWYPVTDTRPEHDPSTHRLNALPKEEWVVGAESVAVGYNVVALPSDEIERRATARRDSGVDRALRVLAVQRARSDATELVNADALSEEEADEIALIFEAYDLEGRVYRPGDPPFEWEGKVWRILQEHTSQPQFTPDLIPALVTLYRPPGGVTVWVQPLGAQDAYALGDRVTHAGRLWESNHDGANVWEPGVFGWTDIGAAP